MKYFFLIAILFSSAAMANTLTWDTHEEGLTYKSTNAISLHLDNKKYVIPANTKFELYEISELNMIKVHLHKYKINNCPSPRVETDLELVGVRQPNNSKTSVGVNLSKGCRLEIFIDMSEYSTYSFLK